jgi:S1-C subfamily serine protease
MSRYLAHHSLQHRLFRTGRPVLWLVLPGLWLLPNVAMAAGGQDVQLESSILLVKPAVVLLSNEVAADVTVDCGTGPVQRVQPDPIYETGSGFIIHPDGFIATNGHVVQRFYEMNRAQLAKEFLEKAIAQACGPALAMVPDGARKARLREIAADPVNRGKVQLFKRLQVHLSTGEIYAAEVKAYSPAIKSEEAPPEGARASAGGALEPERSGKDVAILKIDTHDLPTVRLASSSANLKLGELIFILGYPGVVLNHDFLSQKSQLEASVTVGRVSGFKIDLTNRRVIQTDASITWGNSGGPAFNLQGEVIGVATFISTTSEGDQAIQGFNFLIPVDSVREFAQQIGLVPEPDSPFMREWSQGVTAYFAGKYGRSLAHTDAALRIMAGFPDIDRLRADAQMQVDKDPRFMQLGKQFGFGLGAFAIAALLAVGIRTMWRRRSQSTPYATRLRRPLRRGALRRFGRPPAGQRKKRLPL